MDLWIVTFIESCIKMACTILPVNDRSSWGQFGSARMERTVAKVIISVIG